MITILPFNAKWITAEYIQQFHSLITDPPYSEHVHGNAVSQSKGGGARQREFGFDHLDPVTRRAVGLAASNVQRWGIIYQDVESSHLMRADCEDQGAEYIRTVPWVRWSMPVLNGDRPAQGFEHIIVTWGTDGGKKQWNGVGSLVALEHDGRRESTAFNRYLELTYSLEQVREICGELPQPQEAAFAAELDRLWKEMSDDDHLRVEECFGMGAEFNHNCLRGETKHKAEKPLDQCLDIVSWFSRPGDNVIDLFSGHATIARACQLLGRNCVAFEIDPEWLEKGQKRIASPLTTAELERVDRYFNRKYQAAKDKTPAAIARRKRREADKNIVRRALGIQEAVYVA